MINIAADQKNGQHGQIMERIIGYLQIYKQTSSQPENSFFTKIKKNLDRSPCYPKKIATPEKTLEVDFIKARSPGTMDVGFAFKAKLIALKLRQCTVKNSY